MSITESFQKNAKFSFTTNYLPAILKEYKSRWIIEYYVEHPLTKKMVRKVIRVNHIVSRYPNKSKARIHIHKMVTAINIKLAGGWNPLFYSENARLYTPLSEVFNLYIDEKSKELRKTTLDAYKDFGKHFLTFIRKTNPGICASLVSKLICITWLDQMYSSRDFGPSRYNNFIKTGRAFFNWAKEKCYIKDNPFDTIKLKKKQKKQRIIIPKETRKIILDYLMKNSPNYITILKLEYNALIRPNEIRQLKIKDIDLDEKCIIVRPEVSKNGRQRQVSMTNDLFYEFLKMDLSKYPPNYYVFTIKFNPGEKPVAIHYYSRFWAKIRQQLKLPMQMKQYSLRDTGIFDMLKAGIDDLSVMQHADHHSLEMTTIYANHADPNLAKIIREKSPEF